MYFYANGLDKAGNRLVTSYKQEVQARKYRPGAEIAEGLRYLDTEKGSLTPTDTGLLVRTIMSRTTSMEAMEGNFVVYAKTNGVWDKTNFRFPNYAAANAAVKGALIQLYDACAVIEE